jgi:hypothetical protein
VIGLFEAYAGPEEIVGLVPSTEVRNEDRALP